MEIVGDVRIDDIRTDISRPASDCNFDHVLTMRADLTVQEYDGRPMCSEMMRKRSVLSTSAVSAMDSATRIISRPVSRMDH